MESTVAVAPLDIEILGRAAEAGDARSMTALGKLLLIGRDVQFDAERGVKLISSAVERGDAWAMSLMATLKGAGAWTSPSWPDALALLQLAAERGDAEARAQLVMLAGNRSLADRARRGGCSPDLWRSLRESIDLEQWIVPPPCNQVFDWPKIWTVEKFATPELCTWLVNRGKDKLRPGMMFDGRKSVFHAIRSCSAFAFTLVEGGVVLLLLRIRISLITGLKTEQMEPPQIFHYALGQEIKTHHDSLYNVEHPRGGNGTYQGDRLATFLLYLNDGYEGGDLDFVKVDFSYKGKTGDGIFFASMREGKSDPRSLHGARPVTKGEKYILSQWIHDRPFMA